MTERALRGLIITECAKEIGVDHIQRRHSVPVADTFVVASVIELAEADEWQKCDACRYTAKAH